MVMLESDFSFSLSSALCGVYFIFIHGVILLVLFNISFWILMWSCWHYLLVFRLCISIHSSTDLE